MGKELKKLDLGQIVSILANLGVIAGIVFLAIEIRQNNELLRSEARESQVESRAGSLERWAADGELMQLRLRASDGEQLTTAEEWRVAFDFSSIMTRLEHDYELYQRGRIEYVPVQGWASIFDRWPYMRSLWLGRRGNYSPEFVDFMEESVVNER